MKIKDMQSYQLRRVVNEAENELKRRGLLTERTNRADDFSTIEIYDNGGHTPDRYTVYFPNADYHIVMSDFPGTPRGIFSKEGGKPRMSKEKLGKQISMNQMARGAKQRLALELKGHHSTGML